MYPPEWQPGYQDGLGRYLPDYSYAGYRGGTVELPDDVKGKVYTVTDRPYSADNSGKADATPAIQKAIDAAAAAGGGTVYLPAGTYRLRPHGDEALRISASNILLKGDGPGKTFLFNDDPDMRQKHVIVVAPAYGNALTLWNSAEIALGEVPLVADVPADSLSVRVPNAAAFRVGERILIRISLTAEFAAELNSEYTPNEGEGLMYYRQISGIRRSSNELLLDAPVRFTLKTRDRARITRIRSPLEEVGIEGFSFAMRQTLNEGFGENDNSVKGTGAYDVHQSVFLQMNHVSNGWIRNLSTYKPAENTKPIDHLHFFAFENIATPPHILSKGIKLESSRHITIDQVDIRYPQYVGGGSNGYLIQVNANDTLIKNSTFVGGRHNIMIGGVRAAGNVVFNNTIKDEYISSDHHGNMSAASLFDSNRISGAVFHARYNENAGVNTGPTTTQTTYWNTTVGNCQLRWRGTSSQTKVNHFVLSHQYQWGYVIGSRGPDRHCTRPHVSVHETRGAEGKGTAPEDYVEGLNQGASLRPQSLYLDQLQKRKVRMGIGSPTPTPSPISPPRDRPLVLQQAEVFSDSGGIWLTRGVYGVELADGFITGFDIDDWVLYQNIDFGALSTLMTMRASVRPAFGQLDIRLDSPTGPVIGSYTLQYTKDASDDPHNFTTVEYAIAPTSGVHDVYFQGSHAHSLAEIDWFAFDGTPGSDVGERPPLAELASDAAALQSDLRVGSPVYLDRIGTYHYAEVADTLKGSLYVVPTLDLKMSTADTLFTLKLNRPAVLYLAYDPRIPTLPRWISSGGWQPISGVELITDEGQWGLRSFTIYRLEAPAGVITFGGNCPPGQQCANYAHYLVVVAEQ